MKNNGIPNGFWVICLSFLIVSPIFGAKFDDNLFSETAEIFQSHNENPPHGPPFEPPRGPPFPPPHGPPFIIPESETYVFLFFLFIVIIGKTFKLKKNR